MSMAQVWLQRLVIETGAASPLDDAAFRRIPRALSGPELTLNADAAKGEVKAGLVDEGGAPIGRLTLQDAQPIRSNGLDLPLQWKGQRTLDHLVGQTVRLRITATNAALYGLGVADGRKG
jgi:hypothetical protein